MSELAYRLLTPEEIRTQLEQRPGWLQSGDKIEREWEFGSYKDGLVFAAAAGHVADKLDHHPDIEIGYQRVKISVNTHSVGGLSPYDFELARRIDLL